MELEGSCASVKAKSDDIKNIIREKTVSEEDIPMKPDARTDRSIDNIRKTLANTIKEKYNISSNTKVEELLKIHGMNRNKLDVVSAVENLILKELNEVSVDDSSNKNEKTIESIYQEALAPYKKIAGYDLLYRKIKELYGKDEAKRLTGEMYDYSIAIADSVHILKPYCFSLDATTILLEGRNFGQLHSKPAKRLSSYISTLCEVIHEMSNHLAGAVGIGTIFIDSAHLLIYKENVSLKKLKTNKKIRKYIENEFQQLVYSVNHTSRNSNESPFTNISVFDREKIKSIIKDPGKARLFESKPQKDNEVETIYKVDHDFVTGEISFGEEYLNYIVEYIMEIQKIYLKLFDAGDPIYGGIPFRFPVTTINLYKAKDENGKFYIKDKEMLDYVVNELDIYRYNLFVSNSLKVASCCRLISDKEFVEDFASSSNSFGGTGLSIGSTRVATINLARIAYECKSKNEYFSILLDRLESAAKILKAHRNLIEDLNKANLQKFIKLGLINLKRMFSTFGIMGEVEAKHIMIKKGLIRNSKNYDFIGDIISFINKQSKSLSTKFNIPFNIEQIPGESMSHRLANADRIIFGKEDYFIDYNIYANQFIPLWEEASLWERLRLDGKYNSMVTGGGIVFCEVGEKITNAQKIKIIEYALNNGCEHFVLNSVYTKCESGHSTLGKYEKCLECGSEKVDYITRVVGFFTPVSSWSAPKVEYDFKRRIRYSKEKINNSANTKQTTVD